MYPSSWIYCLFVCVCFCGFNFFSSFLASLRLNREMSSDSFLDLDIFNLSSDKSKTPPSSSAGAAAGGSSSRGGEGLACDLLMEEETEDNSPLFWQPGKRGFYTPRIGKASHERLNAFRNVGRWDQLGHMDQGVLYLCSMLFSKISIND